MLETLVECYTDTRHPVKRAMIAERVGCHPVTVSTRMQGLRALRLVKSTSGPRGGFTPTVRAYDVLADRQIEDTAEIPIVAGDDSLQEVQLRGITLPHVHDPEQCRAILSIVGSIDPFALDEQVSIGPLPATNLSIEGIVIETAPVDNVVVIEVEAMHTNA